jgi:hypothetical protein
VFYILIGGALGVLFYLIRHLREKKEERV